MKVEYAGPAMPQDIQAEMALIGALLLGDSKVIRKATKFLRPQDFFRLQHCVLFQAIGKLERRGSSVDLVTVREELNRVGKLDGFDGIGGVQYLMSLADYTPTIANVDTYIDIVRRYAILREVISKCTAIVQGAYDTEEDAVAFALQAESSLHQTTMRAVSQDRVTVRLNKMLQDELEDIEKREGMGTGLSGWSWGYGAIDGITEGMRKGELSCIGAPTSAGKSTILSCFSLALASQGVPVIMFTPEMPQKQVRRKMLSALSGVPLSVISTGVGDGRPDRPNGLSDYQWKKLTDAVEMGWQMPLDINDRSSVNVDEIRAETLEMVSQHGQGGLVIVDYAQLVRGVSGKRYANRNDELCDISTAMKNLSRECDSHVIVASQLNRKPGAREDKRPESGDLRDSGGLEQDPDILAFLYSDAYYAARSGKGTDEAPSVEDGDDVEFIIRKNRNGGLGTAHLTFRKHICRFDD